MSLPIEVIEIILSYCDGKTLINAREVDPNWNNCVDYLTNKTDIWKRCCAKDIPQNELLKYCEKYECTTDMDKWLNIYENWVSWQDIDGRIQFDTFLSPVEIPRITALSVGNEYIAVGSEDGRVKIYSQSWKLLHAYRFLAVRVTDITFILDEDQIDSRKIHLLVAYKNGTLVLTNRSINQYSGRFDEISLIHDVKLHSVYKKFLCYEKRGGRISIVKLGVDDSGKSNFFEVTFSRIYSPSEVSCLTIWHEVATVLINSNVKTIKYDQGIAPVTTFENKVKLKFFVKNHTRFDRLSQIYRNDIIISLTGDVVGKEFLELFILDEKNQFSKKLFNTWEVLESFITCMFLYGNTFVLGVDIGTVFFYQITSWKTFDIRNYQQKVIIGKHPIIAIDVRETKLERKFYVTSSFNLHEIVGFTIPKIN